MTDQIETPADGSLKDHHLRGLNLAYDALVADIADSDHPDRPLSAGWRESYKLNNAVTCDQLVAMEYMEAAPENKKATRVQNRYRITSEGCAAIGKSDPRQVNSTDKSLDISIDTAPVITADNFTAKTPTTNPDAHIASLTSPEIPPLQVGEGAGGEVDSFCDSDSLTVDDAPPSLDEVRLAEIDAIVYNAIGKLIETDSQPTVDNVRTLAGMYQQHVEAVATATAELHKQRMEIERLQRELKAAQTTLPPLNEADTLRSRVVSLESDNAGLRIEVERLTADLRAAQNRRPAAPQPAAPTTPEVNVKLICEDVRHAGGRVEAGIVVENYINQGWVVKHEQVESGNYYARLERPKPAQPDQSTRAAAEASIPVSAPLGVAVTPVSVPADRITIRQPEPAVVPMNHTEAMAAYHRGDMTMPEVLASMDAMALARGRQAYAESLSSQPVSPVPAWRK